MSWKVQESGNELTKVNKRLENVKPGLSAYHQYIIWKFPNICSLKVSLKKSIKFLCFQSLVHGFLTISKL